MPTADNTHEIAQTVAPESRVVYVDNDPLVLVHARALLTSSPEGGSDYIEADVRDPETILREAGRLLDLEQPVAVIMLGILGNIPDYDDALAVVARFVEAVPSGSYVVINDGTDASDEITEGAKVSHGYVLRKPAEIARYFEGLELDDPGLVATTRWRNEADDSAQLDGMGGVARRP